MFKRRRLRRYGKRKRVFRTRRFTRRVIRAVRRASERKQVYVNPGQTISATTAGYIFNFNQLSQGPARGQRIGNRVKGRWLKLRIHIYSNNIADTIIRISIVRGRTTGLTTANAPIASFTSFWDNDVVAVIWDKCFTLAMTSDNTNKNQMIIDKTIPVRYPVLFNDNNSIPVTNPLYIFVWGNDAINPSPYFEYQLMYSYTDV